MYPHCTVRIRLLYAFNKYFDFDFDDAWSSVQQTINDDAVDQWRERLRCCVKANSRHFKHLLWDLFLFVYYKNHTRSTNILRLKHINFTVFA